MTTPEPPTVRKGDAILRRVQRGLEYATIGLVLPAVPIHYARLPYEGWAIAAIAVSMALWLGVEVAIVIGQRFGVVGTKLFPKSSSETPLDSVLSTPRREPVRVLREAEETVVPKSRGASLTGAPARIVHVPHKGAVSYRIKGVDDTRR